MARGKDPKLADTIRSLAKQLRRGESTVRKWISRDDWPFRRTPPWNIEKVKVWSEINLKPDPAAEYRKRAKAADEGKAEFVDASPLTRAKIQATLERALLIRQRRMIESGKLHEVEACEKRRVRQIHETKSRLLSFPRAVAQRLVGLDSENIEAVLQAEIELIISEFSYGST